MNKKLLKHFSFEELKSNFLAGLYDIDLDEHNIAMNEFHNKLPSIEELIPLLTSDNRNCQYTAAFIAAQEGDNSRSIFQYLFALLESPWEEVRDEISDCFLSCTSDANHYIALFKHLNDSSQAIRLKVITIICGLSNDVIEGIHEKLNSSDEDNKLLEAVALLKRQITEGFTVKDIEKIITQGSSLKNVFAYVLAYKEFGESKSLFEISQLTNESDIKKHYDIYFSEED